MFQDLDAILLVVLVCKPIQKYGKQLRIFVATIIGVLIYFIIKQTKKNKNTDKEEDLSNSVD